MKKFLSFLTSLSLICSIATTTVSCNIFTEDGIADCFDEFGNNVTTKGSENYQWNTYFWLDFIIAALPREYFPDSASFYNNLNNTPHTNKFFDVEYKYTLLISNYESMSEKVVQLMKEDLYKKESKNEDENFVFLNIPSIDLNNIKCETKINFQYLFLIKKSNGEIVNNNNNNWFFWYDCHISNDPNPEEEDWPYFFYLNDYAHQENRVITSVKPQIH